MSYIINNEDRIIINFNPKTLIDEVMQNIAAILSTFKNTVPLYRDFGISSEFLDKPTPMIESLITAEVFNAIEKYEPRAIITNIFFKQNEKTGKIITILEVDVFEQ